MPRRKNSLIDESVEELLATTAAAMRLAGFTYRKIHEVLNLHTEHLNDLVREYADPQGQLGPHLRRFPLRRYIGNRSKPDYRLARAIADKGFDLLNLPRDFRKPLFKQKRPEPGARRIKRVEQWRCSRREGEDFSPWTKRVFYRPVPPRPYRKRDGDAEI